MTNIKKQYLKPFTLCANKSLIDLFAYRLLALDRNTWDYLTIFTNPSVQVGYDTRSIFKRSLTGLNSEFSFS